MSGGASHEAHVVAALRRLGREPVGALPTVRVLTGGLSGSASYRLELAGEDVVLKVTLPSADRGLMARACREARFYQDLAARVPVAVPQLLRLDLDEAAGVVLLLVAYEPSPPPDRWTEQDYAEIARQVGRLHAAFRGTAAEPTMPGWLRGVPRVTIARCRAAAQTWRALGERDELRDVLAPHRRRLEHLLMLIPALDPRMIAVPATICHGDCHAGNLLRGPSGEWIWADWQGVRLGPGVDDLSFFWQRAFAATDTSPPYDAMVRAYGVGLETASGSPIARDQLDRALAWTELRSWLVEWPGYLGALPTRRIERVLRRIEALIERLEIADSH